MYMYGWNAPNNNSFYEQFTNMSRKDTDWRDLINEWVLLKSKNGKWMFGRVDGYNKKNNTIKILALTDERFNYRNIKEENIAEAWVVEGWEKLDSPGKGLDVSGEWRTDRGRMSLNQKGNKVKGTYGKKKGRIEGTLKDNVLKGTWYEKSPNKSGKFKFVFSSEDEFKGKWGRGDEKPDKKWDGTRIR